MNRIGILIKEDQKELPHTFHHMKTQIGGSVYRPESRSSKDTESSDANTDLPSFRIVCSALNETSMSSFPTLGEHQGKGNGKNIQVRGWEECCVERQGCVLPPG